jgi:nucleotide-binding universal stress UspA family protein
MTSPILQLVYPQEELARDILEAEGPESSSERATPSRIPQEFFRSLVCVANERSGPGLLRLAHAFGGNAARVHALHLVPPSERASFYVEGAGESALGEPAALAPLLEEASALHVNVKATSFVSSDPADDICGAAQRKEVDLVLMGWHKPVLRQSLLSGTVARVLKESPAPVGIFVDRGLATLRRVLVPFVGTTHDHAALALVHRLLHSHPELEVTLLHVRLPGTDEGEVTRVLENEVHTFEEPQGGRVTLKVVQASDPVEVTLEESEGGYDLVVVGVGREWGLEQRWLGMHSERLLRQSEVSLLIVRGRSTEGLPAFVL